MNRDVVMPGRGVQEEFEAEGRNNLPIDTS